MDRQKYMKQWDKWREYIAAGGKGSWPRDAFEALLDGFDEEIKHSRNDAGENCYYRGGRGCGNVRLDVPWKSGG